MKTRLFILIVLLSFVLVSCESLMPVSVHRNSSVGGYKYFYITPTETKTGSSGGMYSVGSGLYGVTTSKSTNPADVISGYLIKRGLVRLPEIKDDLADKTMVINYGETGRRSVGFGYAIEITLQIISAKTNEVICVLTGEGKGETEADDIRIAINRCLQEMYME